MGLALIDANAERNSARLRTLLPRREGDSPRIEVPERLVTGVMPAQEARWAASLKSLPTTSVRIRAAVLTPTPGIEVRTWVKGWASTTVRISVSISAR